MPRRPVFPVVPIAKSAGFTLIELLVVVSIIALLIGILLPALSAAKWVAVDGKCKTHLKQVTTAQFAYFNDHGVFSRLWSGSEGDGEAVNNPVSPLAGYLGVARERLPDAGSVMQCPAVDAGEFDRIQSLVAPGEQASSLGINPAMHFDQWAFDPDAVRRSSDIILLGEQALEPFERLAASDGVTARPDAYYGATWFQLSSHNPQRGYRHVDDGANFAMADGSARQLFHADLPLHGRHWKGWDTNNDPWTATGSGSSTAEGGCGCN